MQTSANVSRPPLDAAPTFKDQPAENSQSASTASQRFTGGLVRLNCDCGAVGFNSIVTLLILPLNLKAQSAARPRPHLRLHGYQRPRPPKKILGCVRSPLPVRIVPLRRVRPPAK